MLNEFQYLCIQIQNSTYLFVFEHVLPSYTCTCSSFSSTLLDIRRSTPCPLPYIIEPSRRWFDKITIILKQFFSRMDITQCSAVRIKIYQLWCFSVIYKLQFDAEQRVLCCIVRDMLKDIKFKHIYIGRRILTAPSSNTK